MVALKQARAAPPRTRPARALAFIGFMGAGKSTAARDAARALGVEALDSDRLLEQRLGRPVADVFAEDGEAAFRAAEEQLVCELLDSAAPDSVLALGGGSVLSERVRRALAPHLTVLLDVTAQQAWARVAHGPVRRPLARDEQAFRALHAQRRSLYEDLADAILPALDRGVVARALPALRLLAGAPGGIRMLWAHADSGDYPVFVGQGLLDGGVWPLDRGESRRFCVTDENVAPLYARRLGDVAATVTVAAGESHKTPAAALAVWEALADAAMTRADHVAALGGGVVGDLAGFCAATYQRGVGVVHVPTTLVAQVDSAYGGKTGVDLPRAKNYVGAYHQPAGVVVDPDTLTTLPAPELAAGYAEVVKTALIAGGQLWEQVAAGATVDEATILRCVQTKLGVVAEDERDAGARQVLNLGHTIGHAVETATGYGRYRHGEAVGLGLLAALRLSGQPQLRDRVAELLTAQGLPVRFDGADPAAVAAAVARDKKRVGARVPFVLVAAPGDVRFGADVPTADVLAAIAELAAE
jgi:shikimate kinase/3-dehydroquinate synthase